MKLPVNEIDPNLLPNADSRHSQDKKDEFNDKMLQEMEEELKKTESKVASINPNIHNEVVDELEETRNVESIQESARFPDPKTEGKNSKSLGIRNT